MERSTSYTHLARMLRREASKLEVRQKINLGKTIRKLREKTGISGVELSRRSRLDPRVLSAIETGRIKNPSLDALQAIAKGLGCLIRDLFTTMEMDLSHNYYVGTQKGTFEINFPKWGLAVVSIIPPSPYFFCGKMILAPQRKIEGELFRQTAGAAFFEVIMGKVEVEVEGKRATLKEGENLFLNGGLKHSIRNVYWRESTLWIVTAPSFFTAQFP